MGMTGMNDDVDLDLDLDPDPDWARDLFGRARGGSEPAWTADSATLARAGDRRRRLRTAGAGGGLLGMAALTVAVAVGLGAGSTDLGSQPGPGGAWGNRPLSDAFKYVSYYGAADNSRHVYIAQPAVSDVAAILGRVDPALTHFAAVTTAKPVVVAAGSAHAKQFTTMAMTSIWADGMSRQSGSLSFDFASSKGWARTIGTTLDAGNLSEPCALPLAGSGSLPTGSAPAKPPQWSACTGSKLPDGSTVSSASARIGAGTVVVVVRQFADGEVLSVVAEDFTMPMWQGTAPDPATVVQPTPWSEQSLRAALADPDVRSGWNPMTPADVDGRLLAASDLGPGWSFDDGQADPVVLGQFTVVNGCGADQSQNLAKPAVLAHYSGPLPDGQTGTASETEFPLTAGTGPKTMAAARAAAVGGCKNGPVDFSKDTQIPLPAGIGDEAFAAAVPGLGEVDVDVRVGDTILRTALSDTGPIRDQSWTEKKPLDLTTPAGQRWLESVARAMVARYAAGAGRD
jgi:hypothetical protein